MKNQAKSVFGVYDSWNEVELIMAALKDAGFSNRDISILVCSGENHAEVFAPKNHTHAKKGLVIGALIGAILGGALGLVVGFGSLMVAGLNSIFVIGPLLSTLTGIGMGAAAGGLIGTFVGINIPEHKSDDLHQQLKEGGILVSAHVEDADLRSKVRRIFEKTGADYVATSEHEEIESVDNIALTHLIRPMSAKEDFQARKQF